MQHKFKEFNVIIVHSYVLSITSVFFFFFFFFLCLAAYLCPYMSLLRQTIAGLSKNGQCLLRLKSSHWAFRFVLLQKSAFCFIASGGSE